MLKTIAKLFAARPAAKKASRPALRVESLEDRCVPAVDVQAVGDTLKITGDDAANWVIIDQRDNLVLVSYIENGIGHYHEYSSAQQNMKYHLEIDLKGGNDTLRYFSENHSTPFMTIPRTLTINLGSGEDVAVLDFPQISEGMSWLYEKEIRAPLTITVDGGTEKDRVTAKFPAFNAAGSLNYLANLGSGDDVSQVILAGDMRGKGAAVNVKVNGQAGSDTLLFETKDSSLVGDKVFAVGSDCQLDVELSGGAGDDLLFATLDGSINGVVNLTLNGDGQMPEPRSLTTPLFELTGNDRIGASMNLRGGSYGWINATLYGGAGSDRLLLDYAGTGSDQAKKNFVVDGGSGYDYLVDALHNSLLTKRNLEGTTPSLLDLSF